MMRPGFAIALATAVSASAATTAAQPKAAPAPPSAHIWIADDAARALQAEVPITERGTSKVEARSGTTFYRLSLVRDGPPGDGLLRFDIERSDMHGEGKSDVRVVVSVRLRPGTRVVLAKLARPDGTTTTVSAMLE